MNPVVQPIADLQAPIADELRAVEVRFDRELRSDLPFVEQLCDHIKHYRGKMLRPALTLLSAKASGRLTDDHVTIATVLEMVHMAALVHDDILDDAEIRRTTRTLNDMTSNETAVLVGDYLFSHAYHLCAELRSREVARTVASCANTICEGELLQVHNRNNWNLSEEDYLTIISRKTASLTSVACFLGAEHAGADAVTQRALESFGMDAGIAFQIVDDVLDIVGTEVEMGKSLGRDIEKGKPTLPIIHFLSTAPDDQCEQLKSACVSDTSQAYDTIEYLLNGSMEYAMDFARRRVEAAVAQLDCLPDSPAKESLTAMAEFIVQRRF